MKNTKFRLLVLAAAFLIPTDFAFSGNREGNGGDFVRATYFRMGQAVVSYLRRSARGQKHAEEHKLKIAELEDTLTIARVSVYNGHLKDNLGSDVDILNDKVGHVTLAKSVWMDHFEKSRDVYFLVYHDMLRSAGVNDDNYILSSELQPFPKEYQVPTTIKEQEPLVAVENLTSTLDPSKAFMLGNGCPIGSKSTYVEFDREANIIEITPLLFSVYSRDPLSHSSKNCYLGIPLNVTANQRLVVTQIDVVSSVFLSGDAKYQTSIEASFRGGSRGGTIHYREAKADGIKTLPTIGRSMMRVSENLATPCGASRAIQLHTSARITGSPLFLSHAQISKIRLYLRSEECEPEGYVTAKEPPFTK